MDDADLVDWVLAGEGEAFGLLVERHQRWITVVGLRATGSIQEADDLAQDTFLRAYRALPSWRREASFRTWLARIHRNRMRDRSRAAQQDVPLGSIDEPAADPTQERALLDAEMLDALRRAYDAIPAGRQREVIRMRFVEGRRLEEIARSLGLRVGTVKAHLFRGVGRLRMAVLGGGRRSSE